MAWYTTGSANTIDLQNYYDANPTEQAADAQALNDKANEMTLQGKTDGTYSTWVESDTWHCKRTWISAEAAQEWVDWYTLTVDTPCVTVAISSD